MWYNGEVSGFGAVVARTPGGREVGSSILLTPTKILIILIAGLCLGLLFTMMWLAKRKPGGIWKRVGMGEYEYAGVGSNNKYTKRGWARYRFSYSVSKRWYRYRHGQKSLYK